MGRFGHEVLRGAARAFHTEFRPYPRSSPDTVQPEAFALRTRFAVDRLIDEFPDQFRPMIPGGHLMAIHRMFRTMISLAVVWSLQGSVLAQELPDWVGAVEVVPPDSLRFGAITLSGEWLDTCVPDIITHTVTDAIIDLEIEHAGINVGCGDAITPWSLTEEFGPLETGSYSIHATLYAVDPVDRTNRQLVSGPDVLVESYLVPEPSSAWYCLATLLLFHQRHRRSRNRC